MTQVHTSPQGTMKEKTCRTKEGLEELHAEKSNTHSYKRKLEYVIKRKICVKVQLKQGECPKVDLLERRPVFSRI